MSSPVEDAAWAWASTTSISDLAAPRSDLKHHGELNFLLHNPSTCLLDPSETRKPSGGCDDFRPASDDHLTRGSEWIFVTGEAARYGTCECTDEGFTVGFMPTQNTKREFLSRHLGIVDRICLPKQQ